MANGAGGVCDACGVEWSVEEGLECDCQIDARKRREAQEREAASRLHTGTYRGNSDGPVWQRALPREYITPEDVSDALSSGADPLEVARDILVAVDLGAAEDASLCAFNLLDTLPCRASGTPILSPDGQGE